MNVKKRGEDREFLLVPPEEKHRDESRDGDWPHILNMTNCIVGVSVLAMPFCLQQCGILLGTLMLAGCSVLTKVTCHLLFKAAFISRRRSYEQLALHSFGSVGKRGVELLMTLFLLSTIIAFLVVIGDIGPHILADYLQLEAPTQRIRVLVMCVVVLLIVLPLSLIRNLSSLSVISSITVLFYGIFVLRMLIESIPRIFDARWTDHVFWWRSQGLLTTLPIMTMALSCQTQLFSIADCVVDVTPSKMDVIVSGAVNICSGMYASVGIFGYVAFHDSRLHGDILVNLESTLLTQLIKLGFMLSVAVSIPLMLFPCRGAIVNFFAGGAELHHVVMSRVTFVALTIAVLFASLVMAIWIPNVEFILGLTGSLIGSTVTIIVPSAMYLSVSSKHASRLIELSAKIAVLVGFFILVASTWATLHTHPESDVVDKIMPKSSAQAPESISQLPEIVPKIELKMESISRHPISIETNNETRVEEKERVEPALPVQQQESKESANAMLAEMRVQRQQQDALIKEQKAIVDQLHQHHAEHHKLNPVDDHQPKTV